MTEPNFENAYRGSGDHKDEGYPLLDEDGRVAVTYDSGIVYVSVREDQRQELAALALQDLPFGFNRDDIRKLTMLRDGDTNLDVGSTEFYEWAASLISRIEAFVPED